MLASVVNVSLYYLLVHTIAHIYTYPCSMGTLGAILNCFFLCQWKEKWTMLAINVKLIKKSLKSPISVAAKLKVRDLKSFSLDLNPLLLHQVQPLCTLSPLVSIKCTHQMALIHRELKMPTPKQCFIVLY